MITVNSSFPLAWGIVDADGQLCRLLFRWDSHTADDDGHTPGQLFTVSASEDRPGTVTEVALTRAGVTQAEIAEAVEKWHGWQCTIWHTPDGFRAGVLLADAQRRFDIAGVAPPR